LKIILNTKILVSVKTLETCSRITVLLRHTISVIGRFSPRDPLLLDRRKVGRNIHTEQFSESQAGSGASFTVTGRFLNAATSSLKRVIGRTFKISKCFKEASKNLGFDFLSNKDKTKFKTTSAYTESGTDLTL
jgi:hypothetical protein